MSASAKDLRVFFCCTGVGLVRRGIESFFREAFDGLKDTEGLDITLYKGAGEELDREKRLWNLPRTGKYAALCGQVLQRNGYVVEQLSSLLPLVREIQREHPDLIFYSDSNLGFQLYRWRRMIGVPFRLLFSNGGPCYPPFDRTDHVQQVAPFYLDIALKAGEPANRHSMVPYGITCGDAIPLSEDRVELRRNLGLPAQKQVVLSVGWISAVHKRMDYVISECALLPKPRPHLVMVGHIDSSSRPIIEMASQLLGSDGFTVRSEPYERVALYYRAADVFVLGSLEEGFGRVFLEASLHGLNCIVHDHPVMRYVLGEEGVYADLRQTNSLALLIQKELRDPGNQIDIVRRRTMVERRFGWSGLAEAYRDMFYRAAARTWER